MTNATCSIWKSRGLLVMEGRKVDVEKSMKSLDSRPNIRPPHEKRAKQAEAEVKASGGLPSPMLDKDTPWMLHEASRRKENFVARQRELDFDKESGKVVEIGLAAKVIADVFSTVRVKMVGLGVKLAPKLSLMADPEEIRDVIDAEVAKSIKELTQNGGSITADQIQSRLSKAM